MLADIEWVDLDLVPETIRGGERRRIAAVASVGRPFVADAVALAKARHGRLEPEMGTLLRDHDFYYVRLPLSIRPHSDEDIRLLAVELELASAAGAVCWSMEPLRVERAIKVGTTSKIGAGLKLEPFSASADEAVAHEFVVYQPQITAFGLGDARPAWEFRPTSGEKLSGVQLLHLTVQVAKKTSCRVVVRMHGDVRRSSWLLNFRLLTRDDQEEVQTFQLGA